MADNKKSEISPQITNQNAPSSSSASSFEAIERKVPTKIDRTNDQIYLCTTNVVKAVMQLSSGVEKSLVDEYLDLVKTVGIELRTLLGTVDSISGKFPAHTHK